MYSRNHALLSAVVATGIVAAAPAGEPRVALWAALVAVGVGIDVDHFVIARLNRGDWRALRRCLRRPRLVVLDQAAIFDVGDVWRDQRLLSHMVVGGALAVVTWLVAPFWAVAIAITVYLHVVSDLFADARTRSAYLRRATRTDLGGSP